MSELSLYKSRYIGDNTDFNADRGNTFTHFNADRGNTFTHFTSNRDNTFTHSNADRGNTFLERLIQLNAILFVIKYN